MECKTALTEIQRAAILRQRYDIFVKEFHFLPPREDAQPIESDKYDEYSLLLGVWEDDDLIASCRFILPNKSLGLPTLNTMVIDSNRPQHDLSTAEISRITVASNHRAFKKTIKVLQVMQKEIDRISSDHGITQCIGAIEAPFLKLLHYANLPYKPIGPLQYHIGSERYPVILTTNDYHTALKK